jgi:hypothetical protein
MTAMEPPISFDADAVSKKAEVVRYGERLGTPVKALRGPPRWAPC